MPYTDSVRQPSILILDTGAIRELVTYHAVHQYRFDRLRKDLKYLGNDENYRNLGDFLARFGKKITSTSVVAELHHWIRETDKLGHIRLWTRVREEFESMGMNEESVALLAMNIDLVAKMGPSDVSLIEIARCQIHHHPVVLTLDRGLQNECSRAQIDSHSLFEACFGTI